MRSMCSSIAQIVSLSYYMLTLHSPIYEWLQERKNIVGWRLRNPFQFKDTNPINVRQAKSLRTPVITPARMKSKLKPNPSAPSTARLLSLVLESTSQNWRIKNTPWWTFASWHKGRGTRISRKDRLQFSNHQTCFRRSIYSIIVFSNGF